MGDSDPQKWEVPFLQLAYCPDCWISWIMFAPGGYDESEPIYCPDCQNPVGRIEVGNYNGDALRRLARIYDAAKENKEDDDKDPPKGKRT